LRRLISAPRSWLSLPQCTQPADVAFGSMSLKKSEMRVAELSIGAFLASFSLDRRP